MTRGRGFTLLELMVVVSVTTVVGATLVGVGTTIHREERHAAAYAQDLAGLRRAVRRIERDLRAAERIEDLEVRREGDTLVADDGVLLRHCGRFEVESAGTGLARVRIGLAPRSDAPNRRDATLELLVRMRGAEASR